MAQGFGVHGSHVGPPPSYEEYLRECYPVDQEGATTINSLPAEVISHIMQYLSISDRKDTSLVCNKWYQASLEPQIQKNLIIAVKSSVTHPRPFTALKNRTGFHLALSDLDGSSNSLQLLKACEANLSPKLLTLSLKGTSISTDVLVTILGKCTSLTNLDISCCNELLLSGYDLPRRLVAITLPQLTHLDISSMRHLSDASLSAFLAIAPNLQSVELSSTPFLFSSSYLYSTPDNRPSSAALTFNRFLREVGRLSASLVSLNLSRTTISNGALEALAKVPNLFLKRISLVSCKDLSDSGIVALCSAQQGIEVLDISLNSQLTAISVKHIGNNLKKLRSLNLTKIRLHSKETKLLQNLSTCTNIVLNSSVLQVWPIDEAKYTFMQWCHTLTSLDMSFCAGLSNNTIVTMCQQMFNLTQLNLSSCFRLDDIALVEISKCLIKLTDLSLSWCKNVTDMGLIGVFHPSFSHNCAEECRCGRGERGRDVPYFEYTPPVKDIAPRVLIPTTEHINSAIVQHGVKGRFPIWRLTKLRSLDLSVCSKISDMGVIDILDFPNLTSLSLAMCCRLTDRAVMAIASNNPLLEKVNLAQCTEITDQSLYALLMSCRRLSHLNIANCPRITDNTIHYMIQLGIKLKSLDVSMCSVSLEMIEQLERMVPTLHTVHKRYTSAAVG